MDNAPSDWPGRRRLSLASERRGKGARRSRRPRRLVWLSLLLLGGAGVALYVLLPRVVGIKDTWGRLSTGHPLWLAAAALLEVGSYAAYVFAFHRQFARRGSRIGWRQSYEISLAGVAATRVLAAAGAGGIALTAWALRRSGRSRRTVTGEITTFYVVLYAIFMGALVLLGVGLRTGILSGEAPVGLTVIPGSFAVVVIAGVLLIAKLPRDLGHRLRGRIHQEGRAARWLVTLAGGSAAIAAGVRGAVTLVRKRDAVLLGALGWWAFDIAVLWACFHAFGHPPPGGVLVMAYFTGMLGNLLPLPGGLGGVEGGMIGSLIGFGVDDGLSVAAVLSYRAFAYWLPILPGALAYFNLLRSVRSWDRGAC